MENAELEVALEELESRLERLRALYEQYFMGIERIEPAIPRKDVDRRIYVLRREKIRNTAKRFKLQTIISRYNTFQQYWQRICREIETGTYKRHLIRAERIAPGQLLTIAARKRLGRHAFDDVNAEPAPPTGAPSSAPPNGAPSSATEPQRRARRHSRACPRRRASDPAPAAAAVQALPPLKAAPPPKPGARPAESATPAAVTPGPATQLRPRRPAATPTAAAKTPVPGPPAAERAARAVRELGSRHGFHGRLGSDCDQCDQSRRSRRNPACTQRAAAARSARWRRRAPLGSVVRRPFAAKSSAVVAAQQPAGGSASAAKPAVAAPKPAAPPIASAGSAPGVPTPPKPASNAVRAQFPKILHLP